MTFSNHLELCRQTDPKADDEEDEDEKDDDFRNVRKICRNPAPVGAPPSRG